MDTHSKEVRSYNMSRIRGKNTKPEILVRKFLHSKGLRFRLHQANLPGKPDIILKKYNTIIFVHGCFWHRHPGCKYALMPRSNKAYWESKLFKNAENDRKVISQLRKFNYKVIVIWECQLKKDIIEKTMSKVLLKLNRAMQLEF